MAKTDGIAERINRDLMGDEDLGSFATAFVAAATGLATKARSDLFRLIQVASSEVERPEVNSGGSFDVVREALLRAGVTGVGGSHRACVRVAGWALQGGDGCPLWDSEEVRANPLGAWPSDKPKTNAVVDKALASPYIKGQWRTIGPVNEFAPVLDQCLIPALTELGSKTAALALEQDRWQSRQVALEEELKWEVQSLWWSKSLYSKSRRKSYRKLEGAARIFWMAHDLAAEVPARRHGGIEALLVETLRHLGEPVDSVRPSSEFVRGLHEALGDVELSVKEPLSSLVMKDATLLPATRVLVGLDTKQEKVLELVKHLLPDEMTLEDWALQIFRERQLERWLTEGDK